MTHKSFFNYVAPYYYPSTAICPTCGRCPTCGQYTYPRWEYTYPQWIPHWSNVTTGTIGTYTTAGWTQDPPVPGDSGAKAK